MSAKRNDISKINRYLQGKLDAKAMHQLERDAQDDSFLMDALKGYEKAGADQQANLIDLEGRLAKRVADEKKRSVFLWRVLPIAASLLIMLGAGYSFFKSRSNKPQYADVIESKIIHKTPAAQPSSPAESVVIVKLKNAPAPIKVAPPIVADKVKTTPKPDTVSLLAKNNNKKPEPVDEFLKKLKIPEVDKEGDLLAENRQAVKVKLNGKNYTGGSVQQAVKNLPASVLEKIQVIDDYGDQATKAVAKNVTPNKALIYGRKDTTALGNAVIRGYVNRNKDLTIGSSYIVTGKEVQDHPVGNVEQLLQGKVAGLNIQNHSTTITGKVIDKEGQPIPGASVLNGKKNVATTDVNGQYRAAINKDSSLSFSSIGYSVQAIKLKPGQATIDVKLDVAKNIALAEVAIVPKKGNPCKENIQFKNTFFADIAIVDRYVFEHAGRYIATITDKKFLNALKFIAARAPMSFAADNSAINYADLKTFTLNKTEWLKWYEDNKCNNLK